MKFEALKSTYEELFRKCEINAGKITVVDAIIDRIVANKERYKKTQDSTKVPWSIISVIHSLESNLNFGAHLHNGDPLSGKTIRVPEDRPPGDPPFTWEESAADALSFDKLNLWQEWTIPGALFVLERYNGKGYYNRGLPSPYLWSFSNNYTKGRFVRDGEFDPEAVSKQCGAAVLLKRMLERNIDLDLTIGVGQDPVTEPGSSDSGEHPMYPGRIIKLEANDASIVRPLQLRLKALGCGDLKGTGFFGQNTETAVKFFQARFSDVQGNPLEIDGEVGPLTWGALFGPETIPNPSTAPTKLMERALEKAVSQIGVREDPIGSNRGEKVEEYLRSVGRNPGDAWCMSFVYWCYQKAAEDLESENPLVVTGHCLTHWFEAGRRNTRRITTNEARNDPSLVRPGMIFIIDVGDPGDDGHTGLVEEVISGGLLVTVEGNTNTDGSANGIGVFRRKERKIAKINKGFIDYGDL